MEATLSGLMPSWIKAVNNRMFRRSTGERYLYEAYRRHYGKELNLDDPQSFSAKIFRRMIALERGSDLSFTALADKYLVRDYVRNRVGGQHLIKLLWHGTDPQRIPFNRLPLPYVIKTNHGSGGHTFVHQPPANRAPIIGQLRANLRENYYWSSREFQYFNIVPRVMIEEIINDGTPSGPLDYRCWCFHGQVRLIQVDNHDYTRLAFYDRNWNQLDLRHRAVPAGLQGVPRPDNLADLVDVAEALADGMDFVRVDLYNAHGRVYFGELTFTPRAGLYSFQPESWDETLGSWW